MSDLPNISDTQLLSRLQAGENLAMNWRLLIQRHRLRVLARGMDILGDWDSARDVAQETYVRLYQQIIAGKEIQHLPAFLYQVCSNLALKRLADSDRRARLEAQIEKNLKNSWPPIVQNEAFSDLYSKDSSKSSQLEAALKELTQLQRRALRLFYYQRLSYQAIADELELPVSDIRSALQNGKAKLRRIMKNPKSSDSGV